MATLSSPGVAVTVIDESFYTPAAPGTVPLIVVATAESKQNGAGTGTAAGTLAANAGQVYLLTSQKDLSDTFGTPTFKTDANNNPIHAGEQNEYGIQAAYSLLGVSNRAYVVRADVDLDQLTAQATAPAGEPTNGTFWFDTANTHYGIFEWNNAAATVTGGQTFTNKVPTVITETNKVVNYQANGSGDYTPIPSVGKVGDYAFVPLATPNKLWFKKPATTVASPAGWVEVGSSEWVASRATAQGASTSAISSGDALVINGTSFTGHTTLVGLVEDINGSSGTTTDGVVDSTGLIPGVSAAVINGKLELYSDGTCTGYLSAPTGTITLSGSTVAKLGLESRVYNPPALQLSKHTIVPAFKRLEQNRPTGSVWVKTTSPNLGASWIVKSYSTGTKAWTEVSAPLYASNADALAALDVTGGGINLANKALYVKYNDDEGTPAFADFKIFARNGTGATTVTSKIDWDGIIGDGKTLSFTISETVTGSTLFHPLNLAGTATEPVTITVPGTTTSADRNSLAAAISGAGLVNVSATVVNNQIVITHKQGGDIKFNDTGSGPGSFALSSVFGLSTTFQQDPVYASAETVTKLHFVASLWTATINNTAIVEASDTAPTTEPADGRLWYSSIVDEVDIMIHNGTTWVGYQNYLSSTDVAGPQVGATAPVLQSDGVTALATGDLWIDTSDIENYPRIYKYNNDLANKPIVKRWVLVDTSDQTTEEGIIFADARWGVDGGTSDAPTDSTIIELLSSDFLDFDAPDPALYPKGMLLWNLRRSGFNVKRFVRDYIDTTARNLRYNDEAMGGDLANDIAAYYPNRWVSEAANNVDGSGAFGRKAQRKVVVQALQALVNSNQQIRDEESRIFNLIACPGYPELIGELVSLNYDRGLTAFVVGDTPARLTPDATTLSNWGNNVAGAVEDNDDGLVSFDEYLGVFYPWGYTSDNNGNNVVVPPSHMMLRTIALSDNVSYPWFAPAGTRRGGITNATAVGYITTEGEFASVALNSGQRDTLASVKVNPLTFITGTGLVNYGQYTRAKNASALDRINVARLVIYLRRQFAQLAKPYVFEPNDKITRDEIKGAAESLLLELVGQRALYDYVVVCDTSNNTPARIDRNELYLDVAVEPVKAVEFIYIPLRLKNTGEIKALGK